MKNITWNDNLRLRLACKIISFGIGLMPSDWRTKKAINNLIATNLITNTLDTTKSEAPQDNTHSS